MDRSPRSKSNKDTADLYNTIEQIGLTDINRAFNPTAAEYTFFSSACRTFYRIDHMLGHKRTLNKFKEIESIPNIFHNHNGIKLEINKKRKMEKLTNT